MKARRSSLSIRLGRYAAPALRGILLAGTAGALTACDGDDERRGVSPAAFSSAEDCTDSGAFTETECLRSAAQARAHHLRFGPRFERRDSCEAEYNSCDEVIEEDGSGGGSGWSLRRYYAPTPAGFVVEEIIDEAGDALKPKKHRQYSMLYQSRFSGYSTSRGRELFASQVERGGFGSSYYRSSRGGCCG